jgi:hypothetical protein
VHGEQTSILKILNIYDWYYKISLMFMSIKHKVKILINTGMHPNRKGWYKYTSAQVQSLQIFY